MPNAYKLMCLIEVSIEDVKFLECDYLLVQRCVKITLVKKYFELEQNISNIDQKRYLSSYSNFYVVVKVLRKISWLELKFP